MPPNHRHGWDAPALCSQELRRGCRAWADEIHYMSLKLASIRILIAETKDRHGDGSRLSYIARRSEPARLISTHRSARVQRALKSAFAGRPATHLSRQACCFVASNFSRSWFRCHGCSGCPGAGRSWGVVQGVWRWDALLRTAPFHAPLVQGSQVRGRDGTALVHEREVGGAERHRLDVSRRMGGE